MFSLIKSNILIFISILLSGLTITAFYMEWFSTIKHFFHDMSDVTLFFGIIFASFFAIVLPLFLYFKTKKLGLLAGIDPKTKLYTRNKFLEILQHKIANNDECFILLIDIDDLHTINNYAGHAAGDEVIKEVSNTISRMLRERDIIARTDGDEFTIALCNVDTSDIAMSVAARIQRKLCCPLNVGNQHVDVSVSIGVTKLHNSNVPAEEILRQATKSMKYAKVRRLGVALYADQDDMEPNGSEYLTLASDLRQAIKNDELCLWYQPIMDVHTNSVLAAEALIRWNHPSLGLLNPDQFLSTAEQSNLTHSLTDWVVRRALRDCADWNEKGLTAGVTINLSSNMLHDSKIMVILSRYMMEYNVDPHKITIEITERSIMADPDTSLKILLSINMMGIKISIDDFTTGYSSLLFLNQLPISDIKLDRTVTRNIPISIHGEKIAKATIDLAHDIDCVIVAEGVETQDMVEKLCLMKCDRLQGYYIAPPAPVEEFLAWHRTRKNQRLLK